VSLTRIKILSAESVEILEKHINNFLSQKDIELNNWTMRLTVMKRRTV